MSVKYNLQLLTFLKCIYKTDFLFVFKVFVLCESLLSCDDRFYQFYICRKLGSFNQLYVLTHYTFRKILLPSTRP